MNILFIHPRYELLSIEYLSAILKKQRHSVSLVFLIPSHPKSKRHDFNRTVSDIIKLEPDLIGFSINAFQYRFAIEISKAIKDKYKEIPIIFGGSQAIVTPEAVIRNPSVDMVCVGEGEEAIVELTNSLSTKEPMDINIKNIWFKRNGDLIRNEIRPLIEDLDQIPLPDKMLFYDKAPWMQEKYITLTSRGCPYSCNYCLNSAMKQLYTGKGRYIRHRSVNHVLRELKWAKENFRPRSIGFVDAHFPYSLKWLRELVPRYKKEMGLPFSCEIHPHYATEEMVNLLKEAGCFFIEMGIESVNEKTREATLNRFGTNEEIIMAAKSYHRANLSFSVNHIFNIPFEDRKDHINALMFYNLIRPSFILPLPLIYYSLQPISKIAFAAGILNEQHMAKLEKGGFIRSSLLKPELRDEFYNFSLIYILLPMLPSPIISVIIKILKRWPGLISLRWHFIRISIRLARIFIFLAFSNKFFMYVMKQIMRVPKLRYFKLLFQLPI